VAKPFQVYVTMHAVERFQERVAHLSVEECRAVIESAVLNTKLVPGLYEPTVELRCVWNEWDEYKFRALVSGPSSPDECPAVTTILWQSFPGQARRINRDGYACINRSITPKRVMKALANL
jgi:hypothetical protein